MAVASGTLLAMAAVAAVWIATPRTYTSSAFIHITAPARVDDSPLYRRTQGELIRSPFVATAALRALDVNKLPEVWQQDDPVAWLTQELRVTFPGDAEIMRVSLSNRDPQAATWLLSAAVDAYFQEVVDLEHQQRAHCLSELERAAAEKEVQWRERHTELQRLRAELQCPRAEARAVRQQLALTEYAATRQELVPVRTERRRLRGELKLQQDALVHPDSEAVPRAESDAALQSDPLAGEMLLRLAQLQQQLSEIETTTSAPARAQYAEKVHRDMEAVIGQLDTRRAALDKKIQAANRTAIDMDIARLEAGIALVEQQERELLDQLQQQGNAAEQHAAAAPWTLESMQAEIDHLRQVHAEIAVERERLRGELEAGPTVRLLEQAQVPQQRDPVCLSKSITMLVAGVLGFFIPWLGVLAIWPDRKRGHH